MQNWVINCNDTNINGKVQSLIRSTKTNSPTRNSGAASLLPIGNGFMYIETSANNYGQTAFCSFETYYSN